MFTPSTPDVQPYSPSVSTEPLSSASWMVQGSDWTALDNMTMLDPATLHPATGATELLCSEAGVMELKG